MPVYSVTARDVQRLLVCRSRLASTPHVIRPAMPLRVLESKGTGTYGQVFSAINEFTGEVMAVKVCVWDPDHCEPNKKFPMSVMNELRTLKLVKHPNVIRSLAVYDRWYDNAVIIAMPLAEGGDLDGYLRKDLSPLPERQRVSFTQQILRGVDYLHTTMGIVHRDLKPGNILMDSTHEYLKISDFGTSVPVSGPNSDRLCRGLCTLFFRPPEYMMAGDDEEEHDPKKVDIWSLGCIVFQMVFKKYLFVDIMRDSSDVIQWGSCTEIGTLFLIFKMLGTPSEATWPGISNLANYQPCFPKFPYKRIEDSRDFTGVSHSLVNVIGSSGRLYPSHRLTAAELLRDFTDAGATPEPEAEPIARRTRRRV